jgi:transglutaminase-like putative cysteine protease
MLRLWRVCSRSLARAVLLALFFQGAVCAAQAEKLYDGQIDRAAAIEAAKAVSHEQYPDADLAEVDRHLLVRYHIDGTYEQWDERYEKILTEKGRRRLLDLTSSFSTHYSETKFLAVEVIKENGTSHSVDVQQQSSVAIDSEQMQMNIYDPSQRYLQVNIPELDIGDTVHYIVFDRCFKSRVPGTWSDCISLESVYPINRFEITIAAPIEKPLQNIQIKSEITGSVSHSIEKEGDCIFYRWFVKKVAMAFPEPDMPPLYTQTQRLLVSTNRDWQSISRWYWTLCEPHLESTSPGMAEKVQELVGNLEDQSAKIEAIFKWVSQKVRYLGITVETEAPGYEPHPAALTFERRAGVCRDKAALLAAMLRIAGFEAFPCLIQTGAKLDPDVPRTAFNHAITAVRLPGREYVLMDPTDETTRQLLPSYLNNKSYLVATPDGDVLRTTPAESADQNMLVMTTQGELQADGTMQAEVSLQFNGINDNTYRDYLSSLTPTERRDHFERVISSSSFNAAITDFEITPQDLLDTSVPLQIRLAVRATGVLIHGRQAGLFSVPFVGNNLGLVHFVTNKFGLAKRKYPLVTRFPCGIREMLTLQLNGMTVESADLPDFDNIDTGEVAWQRHLSVSNGVLSGENMFEMRLPEYSPAQYATLRDALGQIELNRQRMVIFRPLEKTESAEEWYRQFGSDAVVLDEVNEYALKDENTWTASRYTRLKILTNAGKNHYSDVRIKYNPVWESVQVKKAIVTNSSGRVTKVAPEEINVMDADWVGDAPRYSPGKILNISFSGVDIGSTIELEILRTKWNQPFFAIDGGLASRGLPMIGNAGVFRYHEPILSKTLRLIVPRDLRLNYVKADRGLGLDWNRKSAAAGTIKEKTYTSGDRKILEFAASRVEPVVWENYLPPWYSFNPVVLVSSGNWETYAATIKAELMKNVSAGPQIKALAAKLVSNAHTPEDAVTAIRNFVAIHIDPVGIPFCDLPPRDLSAAEQILSDGYGHSADRAILLYSLAKAAGFEPEFVLSTWPTNADGLWTPFVQYPTCRWFDDVLVRLKLADEVVYLNDTGQYAALGTTYSHGYPGLSLDSGQVRTISAASEALTDRTDTRYRIKLDGDGSALVEVTRAYYGTGYESFRKTCAESTPEELRRLHLNRIAAISQRAVPAGDYITDYQSYPASETYTAKIDNFAIRQGSFFYLQLPGVPTGVKGAFKEKRINPLYRDDFETEMVEVDLDLPDNFDSLLVSPAESSMLSTKHAGNISYKSGIIANDAAPHSGSPRRFFVQQHFAMKPAVFSPEEFSDLKSFSRFLSNPSARTLLIKVSEPRQAQQNLAANQSPIAENTLGN